MPLSRRTLLQGAVAAGATAALPAAAAPLKNTLPQSVCFWCFGSNGDKWSLDETCRVTAELGGKSVELLDAKQWPTVHKHGLTCAIAGNGFPKTAFKYGLNNPRHNADVVAATKARIAECAAAEVPSVIGFVGYKWLNPDDPTSGEITRDDAERNCVACLKELAGVAEKAGVTVCVEHLNSRDDTHPMKGHPGYQGDDLDFVCQILRAVGSSRVKLLFDVYHVQVMHGDLIRRIDQCKDLIGHVHTAGCPGRNELGDGQEVHYPAVMKKLAAVGYRGFVGHEFIPTRDPRAGLAEAMKLCDV